MAKDIRASVILWVGIGHPVFTALVAATVGFNSWIWAGGNDDANKDVGGESSRRKERSKQSAMWRPCSRHWLLAALNPTMKVTIHMRMQVGMQVMVTAT